jgi:hypothetical protein
MLVAVRLTALYRAKYAGNFSILLHDCAMRWSRGSTFLAVGLFREGS